VRQEQEQYAVDSNFNNGIMTPKQVARYLQMSPRTVYSHWEKLRGLKVGRTLRFRKENIDALFREETKKMERSDQKRKRKINTSFSDKDRSKNLGSGKVEGVEKPDPVEDRNRHRLIDGL
jgi:excisionase family DNA binding protein